MHVYEHEKNKSNIALCSSYSDKTNHSIHSVHLSCQNDFVGVYRQHDVNYFDKGQNPWVDLYGDEAKDKCDASVKENYLKYWGPLSDWKQPDDISDEEWKDITTYRITASGATMAIEIDS